MTLQDQLDRLYRDLARLDWLIRQDRLADPAARSQDRAQTGSVRRFQLGARDAAARWGRVVESFPAAHCYKVQPDGSRHSLMCTALVPGGAGPLGARVCAPIPPFTRVQFLADPGGRTGLIVGAEPPPGFDPRVWLPDQVAQASRCGPQVDRAHSYPLQMAAGGDLVYWGAGRPLDALCGDWGVFAETGVGLHADQFLAFLRANEDTGVWAFYDDNLLRVSGRNLQERSRGHVRDALDDGGEVLLYRGVAVSAREALGALTAADPFRRLDPDRHQLATPEYAAVEPAADDQQPFHRLQEYGGYVGRLASTYVTAPPPGKALYRLGDRDSLPGLYERHLGPDGRETVVAARGFSFRLSPRVSVPRRVRLPEDPAGDGGGYRPAGEGEAGPEHAVPAGPPLPDRPGAAAALGADARAFDRWAGAAAFRYHTADFRLTPEADLPAVPCPPYDALKAATSLPAPGVRRVNLGAAFGEVPLALAEAYVDVYPDGSLAVGGGGGEELRTQNGNWELSCPGDIRLRPGRSLVVMAGRDAVVKARNCVDLSATRGSVRAKAGRHFQAVAMAGGVLIEGRGTGAAHEYAGRVGEDVAAGGVVLKSAGEVGVLAQDLYLGAADGNITLDTGLTAGRVEVVAGRVLRRVGTEALDVFGAGRPAGANRWSAAAALVGAPLGVAGDVRAAGSLTVSGSVAAAGGHVLSRQGGEVGRLDGPAVQAAQDQVRRAAGDFLADGVRQGQQAASRFAWRWQAAGRLGDPATRAAVGFSWRSAAQYGAADLAVWESRWQQEARLAGVPTEAWAEEPVAAGSTPTYPYPGEAARAAYLTADPAFRDPATGQAPAADSPLWAGAAAPAVRTQDLNLEYPVVG